MKSLFKATRRVRVIGSSSERPIRLIDTIRHYSHIIPLSFPTSSSAKWENRTRKGIALRQEVEEGGGEAEGHQVEAEVQLSRVKTRDLTIRFGLMVGDLIAL